VGNKIVFLGDSITCGSNDNANNAQGISWPLMAMLRSGGRVLMARNAGVAGNTSAQMLARFDSDVTPYAPSAVVLMAGTNDIGNSVTFATYQSNILAILQKIRSIGATPILCTIPCNDDVATRQPRISVWNQWLRRLALSEGAAIFDAYAVLVDPTNGHYLASYYSDGTHPNFAGCLALGQAFADQMTPFLPKWTPPLPLDNGDNSGLLSTNPILLTDTNADGIPDGWIAYGGTSGFAHALVTDASVPGKMMQITQTANASIRALERAIASANLAVGDKLAVLGIIKSDGGVDAQAQVKFVGPNLTSKPCYLNVFATSGFFYQELTVPAGTTQINVDCIAGAGTGVVAFGQIQVYNLTAMGLA